MQANHGTQHFFGIFSESPPEVAPIYILAICEAVDLGIIL
jgi:hypothetical protein